MGQARYPDAEALLLEGYQELNNQYGAQDEETQAALRHLAALYNAWDRPEEAARYRDLLAEAST